MKGVLLALGLCGPGLEDWPSSRPLLTGDAPYVSAPVELSPPPQLPPNERRRSVFTVRLAMRVATEAVEAAGADPQKTATVFASSLGDGAVMNKMCLTLADPNQSVSPTIFHNSVHNAPAGYWHIGMGAMTPSNSVAGLNASFAVGLVEALAMVAASGDPTLLVAYDMAPPFPLRDAQEYVDHFAVAMLIAPADGGAEGRPLSVEIVGEGADSPMADPALETLRLGNPAARSLPILSLLAKGEAGTVDIPYVAGRFLSVTVG